MSPASTRTLSSSPPKLQNCLSSTWLSLPLTTALGRETTLCHTATWLKPQRRPKLSTFSQISCRRRSWLETTSSLWSKCKRKKLIFKKENSSLQSGQILSYLCALPLTKSHVTVRRDTLNSHSSFKRSEFMLEDTELRLNPNKSIKRRLGDQIQTQIKHSLRRIFVINKCLKHIKLVR